MSPFLLLLIGMVIVVCSILFFRLHAFLALILGSLVVAGLTEREAVYNHSLVTESIRVTELNESNLALKPSKNQKIIPGAVHIYRKNQSNGKLEKILEGTLSLLSSSKLNSQQQSAVKERGFRYAEMSSISSLQIDDRIIHHTQVNEAQSISSQNIAQRVGVGFGGTCLKIGIMIAMAAIVGQCLMRLSLIHI